ncbi:nitroreductase [Sneathiella glossodoripedis]|uniref:nitroreductase n=1 Tax=Sneathiella glossodoripedis TaxID=418853 RepID=UPI001F2F5638|nr:nitroreductase [Sneathiella glossodoripedis]
MQAIRSRKSVRQFTDQKVPKEIVYEILEHAKWAPSGGNLQPWTVHVVSGEELRKLVSSVQNNLLEMKDETPEYNVYPPDLKDPYRTRRRVVGQALYELIGVPRKDTAGKLRQLAKNFEFFGAPVGLFFVMDRQMEIGQYADLGMFMQNIMLLARSNGLHTCPQEAWARWPETVSRFLNLQEHEMMFCGMALGYMDESAKINELQSERASLEDFVNWRGFE